MVDQPNDVFETPNADQKDLLTELVGDGKKFKTVDDLARGKLQSDIHIARIEKENQELRDKLLGAKSVEDILEAVKANAAIENTPPNKNDNVDAPSAVASLSAEQVAKIVAEQITGQETAKQKAANKLKANDLLVGMFGDKAKEIFEKEASNPALRATLVQLAEVSPEDFAKFFKREASSNVVDNGFGSKNTNVMNVTSGSNTTPGTQKYYNDMRKKNPKVYYGADVQLEMHTAALRDPAKYFGE